MSNGIDSQPDTYVQWMARTLLIVAVWAAVWLVGGYYPFARFVCLGILGASLILVWMEPLAAGAALMKNKKWLLLAIVFVGLGITQALPLGEQVPDGLTGVQKIRQTFADEQGKFPFTLSPWITKTRLTMISIGIVGFFLSAVLFRTQKSRIFLLASIAICGTGQVFWGVVQASRFRNLIFWNVENPGGSVPFGTFLNCNHGADFVGMAFACALGIAWWWYRDDSGANSFEYEARGLIQSMSSSPFSVLVWISMAWLLLGLAITVSRGGWASFLLAILALPVLWGKLSEGRRSLVPVVALACFAVAGVGIQALGMGDRIERGLDELEVENVLSDARFEHWKEVQPAAKHFFPFGSGLGTYGFAYLPFHPKPANGWFTYAHNQYLETFVELGIPGSLLLLIAMLLLFRMCLKLCRSDRSAIQQGLGVTAMLAFLMQALHAFTDFGLMMPANLLTLSVLLGTAASAASEVSPRQTQERRWFASAASHVGGLSGIAVITAILGAALWHQMAEVRSEQLLAMTEFSPATQDPVLSETEDWIQKLETELQTSPDNEYLLRRLVQLRIHHAQRISFNHASRQGIAYAKAWDATSIEATVAQLFDDSADAITAEQKQKIEQRVGNNPQLTSAWQNLEASRKLNPVRPRTHFRMAELAAASGREWQQSFARSSQLSVVDPTLSLGNGLLAWAANDVDSMVSQWKQTLQTDPNTANVVIALARRKLSDETIVEQLMPNRWIVPYRLAQQMKGEEFAALRTGLLEKADAIAQETISTEPDLGKARAAIARTAGNRKLALELLSRIVKDAPDSADARFRYALVLLKDGQAKEAAAEARVALNLEPGRQEYARLFDRARKQQQKN